MPAPWVVCASAPHLLSDLLTGMIAGKDLVTNHLAEEMQ